MKILNHTKYQTSNKIIISVWCLGGRGSGYLARRAMRMCETSVPTLSCQIGNPLNSIHNVR